MLSTPALTVEEGPASSTTYTIMLSHKPVQNVNVKITGFVGTDLTLDDASFYFTPADWNTPQTVTITAAEDDNAVNEPATLTHTASGGEYGGVTKELPVTVDDDEETGVLLSETSLAPEEGNAAGTSYTVRLTSQPTAAATVEITGHDRHRPESVWGERQQHPHVHDLQLEYPSDRHRKGRSGRRRLRRHRHAHTHRQRRRLPGCDRRAAGHRRRRRDRIARGGPHRDRCHRGERHRDELHGPAVPRAHRDDHGNCRKDTPAPT